MKKLELKNLNNQSIEIVIPTDKDNLYYEPTEKLNRFDLLQIFYIENGEKTFLLEDILSEIVLSFLNTVKPIIRNEIDLTEKIKPGTFGYLYNNLFFDSKNGVWKNELAPSLWGGINVLVVMYSCNHSVYLEVFSVFNFGEDDLDEEEVANFKKFMENYAPIGVMKLDKSTLLEWRQQVRDFFELTDDTIPY